MAETEQLLRRPERHHQARPDRGPRQPGQRRDDDGGALNARRYIDVTFTSLDGTPINKASIEDGAAEFTLTGTGVADVQLDASGRRSSSGCRC